MIVWISVTLVAALLWCESKGWGSGVWLAKPLASVAFVAFALHLGARESEYGLWVLVALGACWLGDVLLIPSHKGFFKAGILSFLVGHLCYSAALMIHGVDVRGVILAALPLTGIAWIVGGLLLKRVDHGLRKPVIAYIAVISGMLALGIGAWVRAGEVVFLIAPAAFYLSDLAVARNRFLHPGFVNRLVGLPLYYAAQLLFAWSVTLA